MLVTHPDARLGQWMMCCHWHACLASWQYARCVVEPSVSVQSPTVSGTPFAWCFPWHHSDDFPCWQYASMPSLFYFWMSMPARSWHGISTHGGIGCRWHACLASWQSDKCVVAWWNHPSLYMLFFSFDIIQMICESWAWDQDLWSWFQVNAKVLDDQDLWSWLLSIIAWFNKIQNGQTFQFVSVQGGGTICGGSWWNHSSLYRLFFRFDLCRPFRHTGAGVSLI